MKETRYAVLIGMNNYKKNPLLYSVKDAEDMKNSLVEFCRFEPENIFTITDSEVPVKEQIKKCFDVIKGKFQSGADLLLFYYSGHGEYDSEEEKSMLYFEDETSIGIGEIVLTYLEPLKAKNLYLIVDACHSGKNVYVRPKHSVRKMERKLLNDSRELYFLFAAEENKKAYQNDKLKNSYYTYYFVEAIRQQKLYDEDGFLPMSSIDEYIRKKISNHNDVVQIPGSESRSTGYKPFAFQNIPAKQNEEQPVVIKKEIMENNTSGFDLGSSLSNENRQKIQEQLKALLQSEVENFNMDELKEKYEINIKARSSEIPHEIEHALERSIIIKAQRNNLEAINNLFTEKLIKQNRKKTGLSAMFDMIHGEPEPEYSYAITYNDYLIVPAFIELKAKSFGNVSGGLHCLFYQAKYGFVFCRSFFKYEWGGTHEKISSFVKVELTPYRLTVDNVDEAKKELLLALKELIENIKKWNEERQKEIGSFLKIAK